VGHVHHPEHLVPLLPIVRDRGDNGWITSAFEHSPTEGYIDNNSHGPLAFIPQNLPVGLDDFGWMFAFIIFLLMWLHASNYWGIGRWWRAKTPAFLH
jgi:thiosulfate dehydrogenase [quinone] large subunit